MPRTYGSYRFHSAGFREDRKGKILKTYTPLPAAVADRAIDDLLHQSFEELEKDMLDGQSTLNQHNSRHFC